MWDLRFSSDFLSKFWKNELRNQKSELYKFLYHVSTCQNALNEPRRSEMAGGDFGFKSSSFGKIPNHRPGWPELDLTGFCDQPLHFFGGIIHPIGFLINTSRNDVFSLAITGGSGPKPAAHVRVIWSSISAQNPNFRFGSNDGPASLRLGIWAGFWPKSSIKPPRVACAVVFLLQTCFYNFTLAPEPFRAR